MSDPIRPFDYVREALGSPSPDRGAVQPCEGTSNPFVSNCGAKFETFEEMQEHNRTCERGAVPAEPDVLHDALVDFFERVRDEYGCNDHAWLTRHAKDFLAELTSVAALGAGETPQPPTPIDVEKLTARIEEHIGEMRRAGKQPSKSEMAWMRSWPMLVAEGEPHPWYGPCDGLESDGGCSECAKLRAVAAPPAVQAPQLRDEALRADNAEIAHQQTLQRMQRAGEILVDLKFWPAPNADQNLARDIGRVLLGQSATHSAGVEEALAEAGAFAMSWKQRAEKAEAALRAALPAPHLDVQRLLERIKAALVTTLDEGGVGHSCSMADLELPDALEALRKLEAALQQPVQPDRTIPLADLEQRMRTQALRTSTIRADLLAFADELAGLLRTESQS